MFNGKILILSPHMDDEVLGCGGLISNIIMLDASSRLHIHYFNDQHPLVDFQTLKRENDRLISRIGCTRSISRFKSTNKLDTIPITEHIAEIEQLLSEYRPDVVLVTFPSYNQDHRHIFEATITATRPHDKNFYVKTVLIYEQPETIQTNRIEPRFTPQVFLPIDIDRKSELYEIYKSQIRGHRGLDHLRALAVLRGMQCNAPYAESFMVVRMTSYA